MTITELKDKITRARAARDLLLTEEDAARLRATALSTTAKAEEVAQVLLQQTAKETQDQLCLHIQDLVQSALDSVFPGVYDFRVEFELKRGRTEARLYLDKDGEKINPMDSAGGGVVDIVSFALRLVAWSLGSSRKTIVLDEPFRFVSTNLRPIAGELVRGLSERLGLQIIMVTHDEAMVRTADRIIAVDQKKRRSFVRVADGEGE